MKVSRASTPFVHFSQITAMAIGFPSLGVMTHCLVLPFDKLFAFIERVDDMDTATMREGIGEGRQSVHGLAAGVHVLGANGIDVTLASEAPTHRHDFAFTGSAFSRMMLAKRIGVETMISSGAPVKTSG